MTRADLIKRVERATGPDRDEREIVCEVCNGDGGFDQQAGIDRVTGALHEKWVTCIHCGGLGLVTVTVEPITMEDLQ